MNKIIVNTLGIACIFFVSCGTSKKVEPITKSNAPFGEVYSMPCEVYDTPDHFTATGIYRGSSYQKDECHKNALRNARQIIYEKYSHTYKGMISDYSGSFGTNKGNDIARKIESAGDQVINAILNDVYETCTKFSNVFDDGMIECYVAIEVSKKEIAEKVSKGVSDVLTQEEKENINFNEFSYRKQMEERMKNFKE